jgi:hypothetical protein
VSSVDVTELSPEELIELIVAAKRALYPDARVVAGKLECSQCKVQGVPALVEDGMTVTHDLVMISPAGLKARGWDGSSSQVSEEGEMLLLECQHCFQWHRIPEGLDVEWL